MIEEAAARITAREVAGTGVDWNFAPCIAVTRDERWGRTYESFGESPELAESLGAAAVRGYEPASAETAILATAKHFLGDGGTAGRQGPGRHPGLRGGAAQDPPARLSRRDQGGRRQRDGLVLDVERRAHARQQTPDHRRAQRRARLPGLRGDRLAGDRPDGARDYSQAIDIAINAGIDMVMVPNAYRDFIARLKALVTAGRVPMARIDDSVRRILKQKVRFKMWEKPFTDRALTATIGSPAHRDVARDAVRKSLVVLKNDKQTLPLRKDSTRPRLRPAGRQHGHPVRRLVGGLARPARRHHARHHHPQGDREGGRRRTPRLLGERRRRREGRRGRRGGGRGSLRRGERRSRQARARAEDLALIDAAKRSGKPLVVVLITGRPIILGDVLDAASAVVAAWLPGTEGDGVADVLYGAYKPTGKLSVSWPANMSQIPINVGDPRYAPLFAYGYGLSW